MMREVLEVEEVLLMQNLTVLCIVYGCSIVDAISEVSESDMNEFWPHLPHLSSAYPRLFRRFRRTAVDGIFGVSIFC